MFVGLVGSKLGDSFRVFDRHPRTDGAMADGARLFVFRGAEKAAQTGQSLWTFLFW